jgi:hypothetical protein
MFYCDMAWLDPFATTFGDAVDTVLGLVLLKLAIPCLLEILVEELVDVLEINMIICAAARWHMGGILDGHLENALETYMTHAMLTRKPR